MAREAASVVATSAEDEAAETGPPESTTSMVVRPEPVPYEASRVTTPAGAVQVVVVEGLSARVRHDHEPAVPSVTTSDGCAVVAGMHHR